MLGSSGCRQLFFIHRPATRSASSHNGPLFLFLCQSKPAACSALPPQIQRRRRQSFPTPPRLPPLDQRFYKIKDVAVGTDSAAEIAACWVAEAENNALCAGLTVEEFQRLSQMAEDAEAMFTLSEEFLKHCSRYNYALFD